MCLANFWHWSDSEKMAWLCEHGGYVLTDRLPVHGSSLADLDEARCLAYFNSINQAAGSVAQDGRPEASALTAWLLNRDLLRQESRGLVCTIAGLALFGKQPSRRLPQAAFRVAVYPGAEKAIGAALDKDLSDPFVGLGPRDGPEHLHPLPHRIVDLLQPHISREALDGMQRVRRWDYPEAAIRELVVNAFAHRDWTRGTDIEISVYCDRMEVVSPGALPNGMTIEKLKAGQRVPRNHYIINVLRDHGLMEHQGMGIRQTVIPAMLKNNGVEPDFEATEDHFKVTLPKASAP